ncbi:MAG: hypothetical protein ACAI38_21980 [Myxococcota bacterium]
MPRHPLTEQAHHVWWSDVCERLDAIRHDLPPDLVGRLQFVTETVAGGDFFYLVVDGVRSRTGVGRLSGADAFIEIDREALAGILAGDVKTAPAFRVAGSDRLFTRLHEELSRFAENDTWVKLTN